MKHKKEFIQDLLNDNEIEKAYEYIQVNTCYDIIIDPILNCQSFPPLKFSWSIYFMNEQYIGESEISYNTFKEALKKCIQYLLNKNLI